jgi:hypothetical protein
MKTFIGVNEGVMNRRKSRYSYKTYGLTITSDICLPELLQWEGQGEADINIIYGTAPLDIDEVVWEGECFKISKNELILNIEGIAKYYVTGGKTIIAEPEEGADNNSVKLYLLGTALGTILLQRGAIPIHGSSVVIDGRCVVVTGVSGAGKSTLSSAFRKMGHSFLADDISVITINKDGIPLVQSGYPQQKLWSDSLVTMGEDTSNLSKVYIDEDKYALPIQEGFLTSPVPISAIFELIYEQQNLVEIKQIFGTDKLNILLRNIYRVELLEAIGIKEEYFRQCLNVARQTAFFKLIRPEGVFSLEEQVKLVMENLAGLA